MTILSQAHSAHIKWNHKKTLMSFTYRTLLTIGVNIFCGGVLLVSFWFRILGFNGGGVDCCWAGMYPIQSFELWARFLTDNLVSDARPDGVRGDVGCCCRLTCCVVWSSAFGTITRWAWTVCSCGIWHIFFTVFMVMIGVGTILGRIGMAGGDNGMLLDFAFVWTFELWPAKLLRRLAGFVFTSGSCFNSSGGGGGKGSSWSRTGILSTFGGGGKSGDGIRIEELLGGRSGTQSSSEIIWPMIIAPSKSFDKCWFCCNSLSRIDEYSDADEVLKRHKKIWCNTIVAQRDIKVILYLMPRLNPQISDAGANWFQVQFHVKALKLWFDGCLLVFTSRVYRLV